MKANHTLALVLGAACLFSVWWSWSLSHSVPRADDLEYMQWAEASSGILAPLRDLPPFPGWRCANLYSWWLATRIDGFQGAAAALFESSLWLMALVTWAGWARRRSGLWAAMFVSVVMLATPWFRDLPTWRSWMTTTGEVAFLGAALWAMESRRNTIAAVLAVAAVGFKEPAVFLLAPAAVLIYRAPLVAICALVAATPGLAKMVWYAATAGQAASSPLSQLAPYAVLVGEGASAPIIALAAIHPTLAVFGILSPAAPLLAGTAAAAVGVGFAVKTRSAWIWVIAPVLVLPLLYPTQNPVYLLEPFLVSVVLVSGVISTSPSRWVILAAVLVGAREGVPASLENMRWQHSQWALARHIQAELADAAPGLLHLAEDAPDGCRYVAFWLEERGWQEASGPLPRELGHGLTVDHGPEAP